ncbi:glycosyltransferase [Aureibacillus halotolerans]|uniref:Cellulose synthase/poly-beta-1,6-N-acetylglucosamine synthase-like glycosyltransferase n=1 Tax=Aureibacillus halotolerans TaxID=1508390 RepID=A0A4R6U6E7_9BACI|nr:glycosyltransferase family 2 protein [Aureibacillus halotolerans]TDQ42088.1 cellulose synthase/poly-beta-1,6-N-acetylglucosamine synthase-like glycosyltransferase [Aureibacillus halotolerans]
MLHILLWVLAASCLWTVINSLFMPRLKTKAHEHPIPSLVSILIPVRNEAHQVGALVTNLKRLTYWNLEVIFLDDQSDDETLSLLTEAIRDDERFSIRKGVPKPNGWVGKVFACHQLSLLANGKYYLYIDADIRLHPETVQRALTRLTQKKAGLLTGFPYCPTPVMLSRLLVPMQHFLVLFHLPLLMANFSNKPAFTAAHGAFMLFERASYKSSGGHEAVKNSLVEDVHLARKIKEAGHRVVLANIVAEVKCLMYERNLDVWNGFMKNSFPGIGRSYPLALLLCVVYGYLYIVPLAMVASAFLGVVEFRLAMTALVLVWFQRWTVDMQMKQWNGNFLLMPFAATAFIAILLTSMVRTIRHQGYEWKGRRYS